MTSHAIQTRRELRQWGLFSLALGVLSILLSVAVDRIAGTPLRWAAIAATLLLTTFWVRAALRFQQSLDELQRRMFLEVTSMIGIAALGWMYVFPILEKSRVMGPLSHDLYAFGVFPVVVLAWVICQRRYR